jgi:AmmeMemoRadiSam system protein A
LEDIIADIDQITEEEGRGLVQLARLAIQEYLKTGREIDLKEIPYENWKKKGASFVTLEVSPTHRLRGCIGSVLPHRPLYKDVIHNAIAAATSDPRFLPVRPEELPEIKIKVSVLSYPRELSYENPQDLLDKLQPFKDGVILRYGDHQATFLPDVWEQIPDKKEFLSHLCLKAGLPADCWLRYPVQVYIYRTRTFSD